MQCAPWILADDHFLSDPSPSGKIAGSNSTIEIARWSQPWLTSSLASSTGFDKSKLASFCTFDGNENYHHPSCDDFVGLKCFCIRLTKEMFPFGVQHIKLGLQVGAAMQRQLSCIDMIWQCGRESCRIMSIIVDEQIYEIWCHQLNSWRVVNVDCGTS